MTIWHLEVSYLVGIALGLVTGFILGFMFSAYQNLKRRELMRVRGRAGGRGRAAKATRNEDGSFKARPNE